MGDVARGTEGRRPDCGARLDLRHRRIDHDAALVARRHPHDGGSGLDARAQRGWLSRTHDGPLVAATCPGARLGSGYGRLADRR